LSCPTGFEDIMSERGAMATILATELAQAVQADEESGGCDIGAGLFGPAVSTWIRKTVDTIIEMNRSKHDNQDH
jgi:hypothetical protein